MNDQYHINLEQYSLQKFKSNLQSRDMIPSRVILKDDLDERFQILVDCGITNHKELIYALKTKSKIEQFAEDTGLSTEYLTILNREAKSYLSNPVRLDKYPGLSGNYVEKLEENGIKNSRHLFNAAKDMNDRVEIAKNTDIPIEILDELIGLSDLSRIYGVGPVFARMIYDLGIKSVSEFTEHTAEDFVRIYEQETGKKADFGAGEIEFSLELAKELEIAVDL